MTQLGPLRIATPGSPSWGWVMGESPIPVKKYLTIIPRARMGSESIAHEAEGRMGY